jgi:hypothetical protein
MQLNARQLYEQYAAAVAYVEVEGPDGPGIGSAFHVGGGVFITARHVVEGNEIIAICTTVDWHEPSPSGSSFVVGADGVRRQVEQFRSGCLTVSGGPYFHPDPKVDIAAFTTRGLISSTYLGECLGGEPSEVDFVYPPAVPLGSHLDDWLNDEEFVLREVLVLGYPPIPTTRSPTLVAARAEVNAVVDPYLTKHPHFIISSTARGGFSGGVCLVEWGYALGAVTQSFTQNNKEPESGFMAVMTVEPIYECLAFHGIVPLEVADGWHDFWGTDTTTLCLRLENEVLDTCSVGVHNSLGKVHLTVHSGSPECARDALEVALGHMPETISYHVEVPHEQMFRLVLVSGRLIDSNGDCVLAEIRAVVLAMFEKMGYREDAL